MTETSGKGATIALVQGEPLQELPTDLYIPPEALEVFLETFQGPLDLLLYLIRRQNLDILQINVAEITAQYMEYIGLMQALQLELVGEYLVMAATLAYLKSRELLPPDPNEESDEEVIELVPHAAETQDEAPETETEAAPAEPQIGGRAFAVDVESASQFDGNPFPDLVVEDVGRDGQGNLANILPSDRPVLLWAWAPH